jgi:hypothetical protein
MFRILRQHPHKRRFHLPEGGRAAMTTNRREPSAGDVAGTVARYVEDLQQAPLA